MTGGRWSHLDVAALRRAWKNVRRIIRQAKRDLSGMPSDFSQRAETERRLAEAEEAKREIEAEAERRGIDLVSPRSRGRGRDEGR